LSALEWKGAQTVDWNSSCACVLFILADARIQAYARTTVNVQNDPSYGLTPLIMVEQGVGRAAERKDHGFGMPKVSQFVAQSLHVV